MEYVYNVNGETMLMKIIYVKKLVIYAIHGIQKMVNVNLVMEDITCVMENVYNKTLTVQLIQMKDVFNALIDIS